MQKETVHVYLFDTLADHEVGYLTVGIRNPMLQRHPGRYEIKTVGLTADPVFTMGGLTILPDMLLEQVDPAHSAMLVLPGGLAWEEGKGAEAIAKAVQFVAAGVPVAAICAATAALARGGLLDTRQHTSNAKEYIAATGYAGKELYQDRPTVTDGDVITASGAAGLEFAFEVFRKLDLYTDEVHEATYGLFKTADPAYYARLMELAGA